MLLIRHRVRLYLVSVLLMAITTSAFAADIRFGIFSDTHTFYNPAQYPNQYQNAENKLVPILQKFREVNQSVGLPFVVHLGDLYEDHTGLGTPAGNISYIEGYFDQYSCRLLSSDCFNVYLAMGNHDGNMSGSGVARSYIGTNLSHYYLSDDPTFTRYDYDWVANGYRFIIVDSSQAGDISGGAISAETLTWLSNTLADARDSGQPALIFLHHRVDDSDNKTGNGGAVVFWVPQAHQMRKVINDSGANILGVFMGHNHINDARSSEEVKGWPAVPESDWYKVPLPVEPSRGDMVTEDGMPIPRKAGPDKCSGTGVPGKWDWDAGIFCYSPSSGTPLDHQVDVFGGLDDYAINYYEVTSSQGSSAASPTKGDQAGAIVEVTGNNKTGVVIHGFAEMSSYHTPYTAYINENGKAMWDPDGANDTYASGSIYDPFPTIRAAESKLPLDKQLTVLIQAGHIRESGTIFPKNGSAAAPRIWNCENGAKITNATDVSNWIWSSTSGNGSGWYTLTLANVGSVSEDDKMVPRFAGNAASSSPSAAPQWDIEGNTLYYNPSSGAPSDHLVEAGTYSSVLQPIAPMNYLTFSGPCVFYGARYRGISVYGGNYNNVIIDGVITERNGETGVYVDRAVFTNSAFSNIISRDNANYGFYIRGATNPFFSYILAYNNSTAGLYTNSDFAGSGASLMVLNATFAKNNTGILLTGTGDTGGTAYILANVIVDSTGINGIRVTATSTTGAITNSYINQNSGTNVWGPLNHSDAVIEHTAPGFVDILNNNFELNNGSGCLDAGIAIPGLIKDIRGYPIYGAPDIGAYEFRQDIDADGDDYPANNDCNDNDPTVHPDAVELCDNIDNNCDGIIDEGFVDVDHDGYKVCTGDCDDNSPVIHPGAVEVPYDGIDQDCSGADLTDVDSDGFDSSAVGGSDCNDNNAFLNPATYWYTDSDSDRYGNPSLSVQQCIQPSGYVLNSSDCDDNDPNINLMINWHPDFDSDAYGNRDISLQQCSQPLGYVSDNADCDDNDPNVRPGGPPARIMLPSERFYFPSINAAIADTIDGDTVQIQNAAFTEDIPFDKNISINVESGYDCGFIYQYSTTINGNITIIDGTLTILSGVLLLQ